MRVLVCGGRDFEDHASLFAELDKLPRDGLVIIHGGARGADTLAELWAARAGVSRHRFPANWDRDGKAAGPIRNQRMIDRGRPDIVIAFPGGRGTADMIRKAEAAGVPVRRPSQAPGGRDGE